MPQLGANVFPCIAPALALDKREHIWSLCTLRAGSPPAKPNRQAHNTLRNLQCTHSHHGDVWHQFPLRVRKKGAQHVGCQLFHFDTPSLASVFVIRNNDIARPDGCMPLLLPYARTEDKLSGRHRRWGVQSLRLTALTPSGATLPPMASGYVD